MKGQPVRSRRPWARPLVPAYAAALAAKDALRAVGALRTQRLNYPVVSVGSLSAGGAGKTPVVIALAEMLKARGWDVDVLSRGFGREGRGVEQVDAHADAAAKRFGDEPVLLSQRLRVPVWVGADRFAAGEASEGSEAATDAMRRVHLLDDGFQHRGLARAVDVVVVTEEDLDDALLPAGNRREPFAALRRADVVVLRDQQRERIEARARALMRDGALMWSVRRELQIPDRLSAARQLAFCAIARPHGFWAILVEAGCDLAGTVAFADHHIYTMADMERLAATATERRATGFITTEKDAVKLSHAMLERLRRVGPVCVARLEAKFVDETQVMRDLEARLR